jgi:precorrin-6A synthase
VAGQTTDVRKVLIIGIGAGNPDHLTLQAVKAIGATQVFFIIEKANAPELGALRDEMIDRHATPGEHRVVVIPEVARDRDPDDYERAVADWHEARARRLGDAIVAELADGETGAILVWGDPSLYDSTLRVLETVRRLGDTELDHEVIPGITSVQALAASHRIPLHGVGEPVLVTTGRRLVGGVQAPNTVVMLDGQEAFRAVDADGTTIHWGAYLGTDDEITVAGPLAEVADRITEVRAQARDEHGWIMDIYLLQGDG